MGKPTHSLLVRCELAGFLDTDQPKRFVTFKNVPSLSNFAISTKANSMDICKHFLMFSFVFLKAACPLKKENRSKFSTTED